MTIPMIDTIRAVFTYATALLIACGGLWFIAAQPLDPDTKTIVGAFVGSALTFLWQQETQTRTARQTNTAQQAGAIAHANGIAGTPPADMG